MRYLFIDTSSADVSIAIVENDNILVNIFKNIPNKHSVYTVSFIDEALKKCNLKPNDIDKILVVTGPGSFTGLRIGVTIAKIYGYVLKKDIIEVSSLKAKILGKKAKYFLSLIDARNNNYYTGLYDSNYNEIIKESFKNENEINKLIEEYNPLIIKENNENYDIIAIINYYKNHNSCNPHSLVPNYLKLPQALEDKK